MTVHIQNKLIEGKYIPEPNSGCWLWEGALNSHGYGSVRVGSKIKHTHRISYEIYKGEIPQGLFVLHSCDICCCINPSHLRLGTSSDNAKDRESRGRGVDNRGSNSKRAILDEEKVKEIKSKYKPYVYTKPELANEYGVSLSLICKILNNSLWKHV